MTDQAGRWTRRQFSAALAATAASSLLLRTASAASVSRHEGFAFIGSSAAAGADGTLQVYRVSGETWQQVQALKAASPAHLIMHSTMPVLYVIHDVSEWENRLRGAVSAYRFDTSSGHLTHAGTQPLSLSATNPRHAVVTAGAQALFVAAQSGGIYNLLPIAADGMLQPVSAIRKEFGLQDGTRAKTSAPAHVILHADGSLYAADPGQETVTRFQVSRNAITVQHRTRVHQAAGASQLILSNAGHIYALSAGDGSISVHSATADGISPATQNLEGISRDASMRMHPDGGLLAVSDDNRLQMLRVHARDGRLTPVDSSSQPRLKQMRFAAGGTQLVGLHSCSGEVVTHSLNPATGRLSVPRTLAQADGASSLLLHFS